MSVTIQTGNVVKIQSGNRVLISAPGPQGPAGPNGTPGGTNTQVQFNDSSAFGGDAGLTYNKTTDTLSATNLTVSGLSTLTHIHGSLAGNLYVHVKNTSGGTLAKGTPVYATGSVGASGEIEVAAADYTDAAKMPAIGILDAALGVNAEGNAVVVGEVMGLATNSYAINQELFVGTNGLLGALPASGQAQSIAVVSRAHASTGIIVVNAQARLNGALTALANNDGSSLTGITATQVGALEPTGDGSALTGITAAQVGAVANGDSPTFDEVTLTNGIINSQAGSLGYNYYDVVDSNASPFIAVSLYDDQDPPQAIGSTLFGFRGDALGGGYQFLQGSTNNFTFEGVGNVGLANVTANSFIGSGASLTGLNANNITTGTLGIANGGTGATTLTANNVLLGNGTSALQTVAPGTTGNVLTSNGTTWTSTAPATTNPAGSGSELQFRSSGTAFGALTNSSVSGGTLTLGNAEALATTPTAYLTLRNTTAAAAGAQQVSPSLVLEGQGWKTTATAASQTVRFRQNVLPVQGTTNPTATWRLQSEINNSGTWADMVTCNSALPSWYLLGSVTVQSNLAVGQNITLPSANYISGNGATPARLHLLDGYIAEIRSGNNAHALRLYETDSGANDEYLELSAASGTNVIRPQATGSGTASVVRYHTTTAVFWTSGTGSPESVVTAPIGSLYTRTDGGAATTLYVKESGTGSTGWVAK